MRNPKPLEKQRLFEFSVFRLDTYEGLFADGQIVKLAPKVFQTLIFLVENKGRIIGKDEIFENIWSETFVEDNALSFNISQLRKALAKYDNQTIFIETVPKRGFRFSADVAEITAQDKVSEIVYEKIQTQELIIEDSFQIDNADLLTDYKSSYSTKILVSLAVLSGFLLIGSFAFWQWQKTEELRSFDNLYSTKLTFWKSTESSIYNQYKVSNSGKIIAYSATKQGSEGIFIKQIPSGEEIRITKDQWDNFNPIWSPDDQQIAFVSLRENQIGIYLCPSFGGSLTLLKIVGKEMVSLIKWSKIEQAIYYESKGNLFKLEIESKEVSQITNFLETDEKRFFAVSDDEKQIAYVEKTNEQFNIQVMQLPQSTPIQIFNDKEIENNLVWHPDGKRILFNVLPNNYDQIKIGYLNGSESLPITRGDKDYKLIDVSNDGSQIFYISGEDKSDIWSLNTENGAETEVAKDSEAEFWADISNDGNYLAYQQNSTNYAISHLSESSIVVKNLAADTKQLLSNGINQRWLPKSNRLSFLRWEAEKQCYNLWIFEVISGEERKITEDGIGFSGLASFPYYRNHTKDYDWSNEENKLVYLDSKKQNVWLQRLNLDENVNLTNNEKTNTSFFSPIWSRDGKRLIFASLQRPEKNDKQSVWNVWLWENGAIRIVFSTNEAIRLLGWSDSDDAIFCFSASGVMKAGSINGSLLKISVAGKKEVVNSFEQISALSMNLSADGKMFTFTKRENDKDNIYLAKTDDLVIKKVTENNFSDTRFGNLSWSNDGKTIFFDKQERINTIFVLKNFK